MKKIRILLNGFSPYPEWKLIMIILFSIIGFLVLALGTFVGVRKILGVRAKRMELDGQEGGTEERR